MIYNLETIWWIKNNIVLVYIGILSFPNITKIKNKYFISKFSHASIEHKITSKFNKFLIQSIAVQWTKTKTKTLLPSEKKWNQNTHKNKGKLWNKNIILKNINFFIILLQLMRWEILHSVAWKKVKNWKFVLNVKK